MSKSLTREIKHEFEDSLEDVARSLRQAADGLSDDAEKAVAEAAKALRRATEALADRTSPEVKYLAEKAVQEVRAHPIATAAAALSAAAALISLLGHARRRPVRRRPADATAEGMGATDLARFARERADPCPVERSHR